MAQRSKKRLILKTISVDIRCSNSCKKPNLSNIFNPIPRSTKSTLKTHSKYNRCCPSSASATPSTRTTTTATATATASPTEEYSSDTSSLFSTTVRGLGRVGGDSVAVEKDSDDPYLDFRQSMLQMILEKEIYSKDDLRELLNCFLQLNSPFHHGIIVRAFTEIWDGVFSSSSAARRGGASPLAAGPYGVCMSRDCYEKVPFFPPSAAVRDDRSNGHRLVKKNSNCF